MTDCLFDEEVKDFVLQLIQELVHNDDACGIEEWESLAPIELGVLSWHLDNFYFASCALK